MKSVTIRPLFLSILLFLVACGSDESGTGSVVMAQEVPVVEAASATIERFNEGTNFYNVIAIPPGAETLYLSGAGASPKEDGSWGTMEEQAVQIFETFQATLEGMGWSLADIVQVRVFAVANPDGSLDFEGFNTGYRRFFGSDINPMKPVRSFVQVAALVREGWLVEVEIRAARMPQ